MSRDAELVKRLRALEELKHRYWLHHGGAGTRFYKELLQEIEDVERRLYTGRG